MRRILIAGGVVALLAAVMLWTDRPAAQAASTTQAAGPDPQLYQHLCSEYLDGKWDDLVADINARSKQIATLTDSEAEDVKYIQKTLTECYQPWWKQTKAGKKIPLRPFLWGRVLTLTFDPEAKNSIEMKTEAGQTTAIVNWKTDDVDSTDEAEHGFTKGELTGVGIWGNMATADCWVRLGQTELMNLIKTDAGKTTLARYTAFRSDLTASYYGMPRVRRWDLFLSLLWFNEKYAASATVMSRRAVGAALVAEIVAHADKYPSIQLPDKCPDDNQEEKIALHLKDWIERHGWTVAEDRTMRAMLKTFAANDQGMLKSGTVTLINGLNVALDLEKDKDLRAKRDAWLKAEFGKGRKISQ